jgi:ankyrin repeat protein
MSYQFVSHKNAREITSHTDKLNEKDKRCHKSLKMNCEECLDIYRKNDGCSYILAAIHTGHLECVKKLVENGGNVKDEDKEGDTALSYCAKKDRDEIFKYLVDQGADVTCFNSYGNTLMHIAAYNNSYKTLIAILERGAPYIHAVNEDGITPLTAAILNDSSECAKVLLDFGADPGLGFKGSTSYDMIRETLKSNEDLSTDFRKNVAYILDYLLDQIKN